MGPLEIVYVLVALAAIRPLAGHVAWSVKNWRGWRDEPDFDDWRFGVVVACLLAAVWPLSLLCLLVNRYSPKIGAERAAELERREQRLREAEREVCL